MATKKKMLQAAAGNATGGAGLDITDVFSTYLYTGNGATQTITNDIDLAGEGGLVWVKERTGTRWHVLTDSERGVGSTLFSNDARAEELFDHVTSLNSDGFGIKGVEVNGSGQDYASWTFRKAPKFFDVVTYTGTGSVQNISHNLGTTVGSIFIKRLDAADSWITYHRGIGAAKFMYLDRTDAAAETSVYFNNTEPTDSVFTVATNRRVNQSGSTYVAYLFAHNDGDGGFGPDGDADIIKCGSYSQSSASDVDVDLGFEPQFVIVKRSDDTSQWYILDEMRGFLAGSNSTSSRTLYASLANAEADFTIQKTATGFTWPSGQYGSGTQEYIYMAIRRGPLAQPESATEVFDVQFNGGNDPSKAPVYQSGFVTDMSIVGLRTGGSVNYPYTGNRLMGIQTLETHNTDAEESGGASFQWDFMNGFIDGVPSVITDTQIAWMWKRAPGFFDVVAYTGDGTGVRTVSHNLGVAPEMMWVKNRDTSAVDWTVYHKDLGPAKHLKLNSSDASADTTMWASTSPTGLEFYVDNFFQTNVSGDKYIAYLFSSIDGVAKVGSYTGTGGSQTIDCGFTSGARFVLVKRKDSTGDWFVWDTERGISSGNDPYLALNTTSAEVTVVDTIDPTASGFIARDSGINASDVTYIFYAIA